MDVSLSPEFDDQGSVKGFIFHSIDITEKCTTERALKDYLENASIGMHWVNEDGMIIWANPAELKMLGYAAEEYIGHHISEFHVRTSVVNDILQRLARNEILQNFEAELLCKDNSIRHVAINSSVLWEADKFIHTRCFTIDITEQKRAAQIISESEERFKMMANLVPLVIWTTDENGNCNYLNIRWTELTGEKIEDGLGNQWLNLIHAEDRENIQHSWSKSVASKKIFEAKFRYRNAHGGYTVSYTNASPRYNTWGDFIGYIGILQDISLQEQIKSSLEKIVLERTDDLRRRNKELQSAENALVEKNRELERINNELSSFAHVASHDLQEPLRKIQTFVDRVLSLEGDKFSEKGRDFFNRIQTSSNRMRALIGDLLTYSRSSSVEEACEVTDLNEIFQDVVCELEVKIEEKNAVVENLGLPILAVVKFQFHQLFLNLLSNAIKFSKTGVNPHIIIKSERVNEMPGSPAGLRKEYHHISIADNGIGFEPEYNAKIFEIFHRLQHKKDAEGTGIGLAICKKIAENHNGILTAEGNVHHGATFHIYLPLSATVT